MKYDLCIILQFTCLFLNIILYYVFIIEIICSFRMNTYHKIKKKGIKLLILFNTIMEGKSEYKKNMIKRYDKLFLLIIKKF